jgi:hypothetical protein
MNQHYRGVKFAELEMKTVLATLIPAFRFAPSKQKVIWRFGLVVTPSVEGSSSLLPQLPLHLTLT